MFHCFLRFILTVFIVNIACFSISFPACSQTMNDFMKRMDQLYKSSDKSSHPIPIPAYDEAKGYKQKVIQSLIGERKPTLWMIVHRVLKPEYAIILTYDKKKNEWIIEKATARENIWRWKETGNGQFAPDIKVTEDVERRSLIIRNENLSNIEKAWTKALRTTRYTSSPGKGFVGTTYQFYARNKLFGETWSTSSGTSYALVKLGKLLGCLVEKPEKTSVDNLKYCLPAIPEDTKTINFDLAKVIREAKIIADEILNIIKLENCASITTKAKDLSSKALNGAIVKTCSDIRKARIKTLTSQLENKHIWARLDAIKALADIHDKEVIPVLIRALQNSSSEVRKEAIYALGNLKARKAEDEIINALRDKKQDVRSEAARVLGEMKVTKAIEPLISVLSDESDTVRQEALSALAILKDRKAVVPISLMLKDADYYTRYLAAIALRDFKDKKSIAALVSALDDEDGTVQNAVAEALEVFEDPEAKDALKAYRKKSK